ncbi:MAG: peptidoglycan-binding protein LysM [Marinicellaceae bacterium]
MGFFDFIAEAGADLFSKDEPKPEIVRPIIEHLKDAAIFTDHLKVDFNAGAVTLSGYVPNQEQKEKAVLVSGNIAGVASVQDNLILGKPPKDEIEQKAEIAKKAVNANTTEATFRTYTVKSGDTLGAISKEMYGKASLYNKIFKANTPMLKDADHIYPGQVLKIPE